MKIDVHKQDAHLATAVIVKGLNSIIRTPASVVSCKSNIKLEICYTLFNNRFGWK